MGVEGKNVIRALHSVCIYIYIHYIYIYIFTYYISLCSMMSFSSMSSMFLPCVETSAFLCGNTQRQVFICPLFSACCRPLGLVGPGAELEDELFVQLFFGEAMVASYLDLPDM